MADCDTCGGCGKTKTSTVDYKSVSQLLVRLVEKNLPLNIGHSERVSEMAMWLGRYLGIDQQMVDLLGVAGLLHDCGMTDLEHPDLIQTHPVRSAALVGSVIEDEDLTAMLVQHHERYDGTGYPNQLKGDFIHLGARLLHFCEAIDTMANDQPYQSKKTFDQIEEEVGSLSGLQFDPWFVMHLKEFLTIYQEKFPSE